MASHHGPGGSPARRVTSTSSVGCFCTAMAGLNLGASLLSPLPASFITPCPTALLPPDAPAVPTASSENWSWSPPPMPGTDPDLAVGVQRHRRDRRSSRSR